MKFDIHKALEDFGGAMEGIGATEGEGYTASAEQYADAEAHKARIIAEFERLAKYKEIAASALRWLNLGYSDPDEDHFGMHVLNATTALESALESMEKKE